jgi:hypothetical protein
VNTAVMPLAQSMRLRITLSLLLGVLLLGIQRGWTQSQNETYDQTRTWLLRMNRRSPNEELRKMFEEADTRIQDLIKALDDPQKEVNLNAQVIIKYLADPTGLKSLNEWYRKQIGEGKGYSMPKLELLSEAKYLEGVESDLAKLAMKNKKIFEASAYNADDVTARLIAYNKRAKIALIEIIQGEIFTAGWHAVIKQEGDRWRLMSDNNIWVH